jgi:hypothetical protein
MSKEKDFITGVANGVFGFLADRPVSVIDPMIESISEACAKELRMAVLEWMDYHRPQIISAIAAASKEAA